MKLFRKLAALSLTAALSAGMVLPASAASAPSVQVDGGTVDTSAYINADSRTMVPVTIAEALGLDCTADGDSAAFSLCGRSQTYSAGTAAGDTTAALQNGQLYIPLYHLAQTFGPPAPHRWTAKLILPSRWTQKTAPPLLPVRPLSSPVLTGTLGHSRSTPP